MIRLSHATIYTISGIIWLAIGAFLLNLGLQLIMQGVATPESCTGFFPWLSTLTNGAESAAIALIAPAVLLGYCKGRFVMQKVARRTQARVMALENPTSIGNLYTKANFIVIGVMMLLGMAMRYFNVPNDIRGPIDVAVGAALIQGSVAYFRLSRNVH